MRRIERAVLEEWVAADREASAISRTSSCTRFSAAASSRGPTRSIRRTVGCIAAAEKNLPMFVPGWEDATLGNMYAGHCISGDVKNVHTVRTGIEYMMALAEWYTETSRQSGRSASSRSAAASRAISRFASCQCCTRTCSATKIPLWGYFCQISDSTTSYGSYSGAVPERKDHLGQARRRHAEVHHRIRRHHRRAA